MAEHATRGNADHLGYATARRGAHLRVYVGRDTHELALAIADGSRIVELAHRTLADATELH